MSSEWLAPLATALTGLLGGGAVVAYLQRDKTSGEADLAHAQASVAKAEAESKTVETITNAMQQVERLSQQKDQQIAQVRVEMLEQSKMHHEQQIADRIKHSEELATVQTQLNSLRENQKALAGALAAHGQWDLYALSRIRTLDPDFPDPPPLNLDMGQ